MRLTFHLRARGCGFQIKPAHKMISISLVARFYYSLMLEYFLPSRHNNDYDVKMNSVLHIIHEHGKEDEEKKLIFLVAVGSIQF